MSRYETPAQLARFERLATDLGLELEALERLTRNPAAFERDVLRGNLKPLVQLLPTPARPPPPRRRPRRPRAPARP